MQNVDSPLGELNHRVKNNFQIIISLMNLKKRMMPPENREDIRFLQDHVQSMAVAYRLAYASGESTEVPISDLLSEVVSELRQIGSLDLGQLQLSAKDIFATINLDKAIAFALYLAVVLPPFIDRANMSGSAVVVSASVQDRLLTLSVAGSDHQPLRLDALRSRLSEAYVAQLHAEVSPLPGPVNESGIVIRFMLEAPHG